MPFRIFNFVYLIVTFLLLFSACTTDSGRVVRENIEILTIDSQVNFGEELVNFMKENPESYDILNGNAYEDVYLYLEELLTSVVVTEQMLLRNSFDWEIIPMEDEEIYAYSIPGGKLIISIGMLKFLRSEAELVALLAHELNYPDKQMLNARLLDEFDGFSIGDVIHGNEIDVTDMIYFFKYFNHSESAVMEADLHALSLLCPFNYNINAWKSAVQRVQGNVNGASWIAQRPRIEDWTSSFDEQVATCESAEGDIFRERYLGMIAELP